MTRRIAQSVWMLMLPIFGCGGEEPNLAPVRGKVYFQGAPLQSGTIVFVPNPDRGGSGPMAVAKIQSDGSFVLRTDEQEGAVPGWHRVAIVSPLSLSSSEQALPHRYSDPEISGQSCEVKLGRDNEVDFHLK